MEALIRLLMVVAVAVGSSVIPAARVMPRPPSLVGGSAPSNERVAVGSIPISVVGGLGVTGNATWYDAPSIHDAAAGPNLRKALGSHWRGSVVRVSSGGHSVVVTLSDWCACRSGNRIVDLDRRAFAKLADPSAGVIAVSITVVGGIDTPAVRPLPTGPRTDTEEPR